MVFTLTIKSRSRLSGVHPDLVKVVHRVLEISDADFFVLEGLRTLEQEKANVAKGASQTLNSRHLTGHAIDIGARDEKGILTWDYPRYTHLSTFFKKAAEELGVALTWGGDWKTFKDGGHYELNWKAYPAPHEEAEHNDPAAPAAGVPNTQSPASEGQSGA